MTMITNYNSEKLKCRYCKRLNVKNDIAYCEYWKEEVDEDEAKNGFASCFKFVFCPVDAFFEKDFEEYS